MIFPLLKPEKRTKLEERCDRLASRYYKRETDYCEAAANSGVTCWGTLEWCHIVSRRVKRLRYEPYNKLIMCHGHHAYFSGRPNEWKRFVRHYFPDRWREVEAHRNEFLKPDLEAWIERFK